VGIRWLGGRSLHTARSFAQILVGSSMSLLICLKFVVDLVACRLSVFTSAVACRPVTQRLWSGFLAWLL
jgi:hypothetical protein